MYKLITIDLDGTLLNRYGEVTEYTKNVIKQVTQKGIFKHSFMLENLESVIFFTK